jgi:hypothetical protein
VTGSSASTRTSTNGQSALSRINSAASSGSRSTRFLHVATLDDNILPSIHPSSSKASGNTTALGTPAEPALRMPIVASGHTAALQTLLFGRSNKQCEQCNHAHPDNQHCKCYGIVVQPIQPLLHLRLPVPNPWGARGPQRQRFRSLRVPPVHKEKHPPGSRETRSNTSPSRGMGSGQSRYTKFSSPPCFSITAAFMRMPCRFSRCVVQAQSGTVSPPGVSFECPNWDRVAGFEVVSGLFRLVLVLAADVTPAMAAGVTDRLWEIGDIVQVLEDWENTN